MGKNHKNNHYHYVEKFSDRSRRRQNPSVMRMPRRAVFFAALVLLIFGVITFTFSTDQLVPDPSENNDGSMIVTVRNAKANRDLALTGANVDYAGTGYSITGGKIISIDDNTAKFTDTYGSNVYLVERTSNKQYFYKFSRVGNSYYYSLSSTANSSLSDGCMIVFLGKNISNGSTWDNTWADFVYWGPNNENFKYKYGIYCGLKDISNNTRFTLNADGSASNATGSPEGTYDNGIDVQLQYKVGAGSYTNASNSVSPGTTSVTLSQWNSSFIGGSSGSTNVTKSGHFDRVAKNTNMSFQSSAGTGFDFVDYYNNTASVASTNNPYTVSNTYASNTNHTIYARYKAKKYTVTYNLTGGTTVDHEGQNPSTTPSDAVVGWATGYSAPEERYYTQSLDLPVASNLTATGRKFLGWYASAACTGSKITSISATTASNTTLYAKWEWDSYTITYNKGDGLPVTGTIEGTVAAGTKTYNVDYTIKSSSDVYTRSGFTQAGWSSVGKNQTSVEYDFEDTYSTNENLTLYPVWTLDAPTASLSGGTMVAGDQNGMDLSPSVSAPDTDVSQAVTYHISGPEGHNATITASDGTSATADDAVFKTTTPGTYTVYVTAENTASTNVTNDNNKASASSTSVTINVQPIAPTFTFTINGIANPEATGTAGDPFLILQGGSYDFTGTVTSPVNGYTYEWSLVSNFTTILGTGTTITFNDDDPRGVSGVTQGYQPTSADNAFDTNTITLYCRARCNSQYNSGGSRSLSYEGQPLVEDFKFVPYQTIYQNNDSSVSLSAQYNMTNAQGYTTNLMFSPDNEFINNIVAAATVLDEFMTAFVEPIKRYLYPDGPKYFYMNITATINDRQITSNSAVAHTTVGTLDSSAAKPLYFYNKTSTELSDYQVMCYWVDSAAETYGYQIAQDLHKNDSDNDGFIYRVNIPATAVKVQFALVRKDENKQFHYYGTPTFENNTFTFSAPHYAGSTNLVTLTDATRVIQTGVNATATIQTVNGKAYTQYSFACTPSAYATN